VIDGIQRALAGHSIASDVYRTPAEDPASRQELSSGGAQCAIGVGLDGLRALLAAGSRIPVVATMTFRGDFAASSGAGSESKVAGAVWLDLPVSSVAAGLLLAFPSATRLVLVRNPSQPETAPGTLPPGITLKPVECRTAPELLTALRKLRGQADFVICTPDSELYNKSTVEPLILASLEHKLPLVGYSASFVHAGAAVGVYPDFAEVGRQTAGICERIIGNAPGTHEEYPRRTSVAVNERVLHLLGREFRPGPNGEVTVIR
jgi:hypothetical protein